MTVISWSYSKLTDFEKCKRYFKLKHVDRIPEPERPLPPGKSEHANDRGTRIHQSCEDYVRGLSDTLVPEADRYFGPQLDLLRTMHTDGLVSLEGEWGLDASWAPWAWGGQWTTISEPDDLGLETLRVKALPDRPRTDVLYKIGRQAPQLFAPPWLRMKIDALVMHDAKTATVIDYKGLPLQTMIPTPGGWSTMGQIQVGESLFDRDGNVCTVNGKSEIKHLPNYRLTFDDTSTVECDEEHLWVLVDGSVRLVTELSVGDQIPTAGALQLPAQDLPIDPYVLGVWLADGKHTSGEITEPDDEIWGEIVRRGYALSHDYNAESGRCCTRTVRGLRGPLVHLGLLGNKHIPQMYLRASYEQRLDLLRGLFDGDGSANHTRKQAVLNTARLDFARQVQELLLSLGQRPLLSPYVDNGFGKTTQAYLIAFRPNGINPFLLPRKADKVLTTWGAGESWRRKITGIEKLPPQPTQCISVDSPTRTFLCTEKFIPTHNTGKKYGNEVKHGEQLQLYALATFMRYPELETVFSELWYLDQDVVTSVRVPRKMGLRYAEKFAKRGNAIVDCLDFPPNPNVHSCRWCQYGPWNGGQCEVGVR